jgi:hypothetical protein
MLEDLIKALVAELKAQGFRVIHTEEYSDEFPTAELFVAPDEQISVEELNKKTVALSNYLSADEYSARTAMSTFSSVKFYPIRVSSNRQACLSVLLYANKNDARQGAIGTLQMKIQHGL